MSKARLGGGLLRLVTAGMHEDPLVVYRECLQNAADSIATQGRASGQVRVEIDPVRLRFSIEDDGGGLSEAEAVRRLLDLGQSEKSRDSDRGFWGIGRLSALAFADEVRFATRRSVREPVTEVIWSGRALRRVAGSQEGAGSVIEKCTEIRRATEGTWPEQFFRVTVQGVNRHAAGSLLNEDAVRTYVSEVCPVPMSGGFPLGGEVRDFIAAHTDYFVLDVRINGDDKAVERPFGATIPLNEEYSAAFESVETRRIPGLDGDAPAAVVWLAHSPYAGSIPRRLGIRGLRARAGNIQIGTDRIFEHLFVEPRFNGWCVGEVHIVDTRLAPNGRRDYFEPGPRLRNLENHIGAIAQEISTRCRRASSQRNRVRRMGDSIQRLRRACDLVFSGYLRRDDAIRRAESERKGAAATAETLGKLEKGVRRPDVDEVVRCGEQLGAIEHIRERPLEGVSADSEAAVRLAFGAIADAMPPGDALEMIEAILARVGGQPSRRDAGGEGEALAGKGRG